MQTISAGKWRGLKATSTDHAVFSILAFDQRGNYVAMLPESADFAIASRIKAEVVSALAPHTTAVLLDPVYGLEAALTIPGSKGILLAIEKTGYAGSPTAREIEFIPGWDVGAIQHAGASAVKLLVYYHPDSPTAETIERTITELAGMCKAHDLPLFVEPLSYSLDPAVSTSTPEFAQLRPRIVIETARRLSRAGADVLKMEFPVSVKHDPDEAHWAEACAALSEASTVPWTILSAGVDYPMFERQVTVACANGASGFVGGRAIWKEAITMTTDARAAFLRGEAADRLKTLTAIVTSSGRAWTTYYAPPLVFENAFVEKKVM